MALPPLAYPISLPISDSLLTHWASSLYTTIVICNRGKRLISLRRHFGITQGGNFGRFICLLLESPSILLLLEILRLRELLMGGVISFRY